MNAIILWLNNNSPLVSAVATAVSALAAVFIAINACRNYNFQKFLETPNLNIDFFLKAAESDKSRKYEIEILISNVGKIPIVIREFINKKSDIQIVDSEIRNKRIDAISSHSIGTGLFRKNGEKFSALSNADELIQNFFHQAEQNPMNLVFEDITGKMWYPNKFTKLV